MVDGRAALRADCSRCVGLCCVAPGFVASADFALTKPAGRACPNLTTEHRCSIHDRLRPLGFPGCAVFDCFGAGQHIVALTLTEPTQAPDPAQRQAMHAALNPARAVGEVLHHLEESAIMPLDEDLLQEVTDERSRVREVFSLPVQELAAVDVGEIRQRVGPLLGRVSAAVRAGDGAWARRPARFGPHAELSGAKLRGADLTRADLRGSILVGADLRDAALHLADLLGADLRGADVRGAEMATALFLTRPQLEAARGDARTTIPAVHDRPGHWR